MEKNSLKEQAPMDRECRTCNRRRIHCDGTLPTCLKCAKKGLQCPGYERKLRWANGVAVRGHLRGRQLPVSKAGDAGAAQPEEAVQEPERRKRQRPLVTDHVFDEILGQEPSQFLKYYDKNLAGLMVWMDSEQNLYRTQVLPRAMDTLGLRYAIMAISSQHGSEEFSKEGREFHQTARDACLALVQAQLKEMNGRVGDGFELATTDDIEDAEWMLASILMLACYEMSRSQIEVAEGHRLAARRLVQIFQGHPAAAKRQTFAFLRNQLAIYDVLVCTTSFNVADIEGTNLPPTEGSDGLFASYLRLIHEITLLSRKPVASIDNQGTTSSPIMSASDIRLKFNQARGATLIASGKISSATESAQRDFIRLVDIYHYTAILYSYRCLGYDSYESIDRASTLTKLFEQIDSLEDMNTCIQNLPWAFFIAGVESHGDTTRQQKVKLHFDNVLKVTGFQHYTVVFNFLTTFWAGHDTDWRPLAESWQRGGVRILLV
ncbi:hypothetical protein VHEMI03672 [[Torrubiella] hemipterigena]|uniref:Zn(2)-C6 fungal-type domain-containing protein n=1 Tax=[Torrubiella] hemipterigena TaxID=1531966 RepID=A0A0A1TE59_9HYPO|nr:hypothetical protein VHEMI03672 [[Torrubiella] hemipterigena]